MLRRYIALFFAVLLLTYVYPIEARELNTARIEGMLWTLAEGIPHRTSIVVEAVPIGHKVENLKVAHSNSNSYILEHLPPGRYQLRCHGWNEYIYHKNSNGQISELTLHAGEVRKNVNFRFPPFKKGIWKNYTYLENRLPGEIVLSIQKMSNGQMWFVTNSGSCSFDGQTFNKMPGVLGKIRFTLQEGDGTTWISTEEGVYQYQHNKLTPFLPESKLSDAAAIHRDRHGNIWVEVGGAASGVFRYDGKELCHFTEQDGLIANQIHDIFSDLEGNVWFIHSRRWFGEAEKGISKFDGQRFIPFTIADGLPSNNVRTVNQDVKGKLWFGTKNGLAQYDDQTFRIFTTEDGLPSNKINHIFFDQDGTVWLATEGGISRFDGKRFVNYSQADGLVEDLVFHIYRDSDDTMWFSTRLGVSKYSEDHVLRFTTEDGLVSNTVQYVYKDRQGLLWLGIDNNLTFYDGKQFVVKSVNNNLVNIAGQMHQDKDGTYWFSRMSYEKGISHGVANYDGNIVKHYTVEDGLVGNNISSIHSTPDGVLWFGATNRAGGSGGLSRYHKTYLLTLPFKMGWSMMLSANFRAIS